MDRLRQRIPAGRPARLADRLVAARRACFVGRERELAWFESALAAPQPDCAVVHVHGPGGVGKTTLLREYARIAGEAGVAVLRVDARHLDPRPEAFLGALHELLDTEARIDAAVRAWPPRSVLLVDTFEALAPLEDWLREELLPQLPAATLVVLAGRNEPAAAWRTDADWATLTRILPLDNLADGDSRRYLVARGVAAQRHPEVLAFTRGHPLALSVVADVLLRGGVLDAARPEREPEIVRSLLQRFLRELPDMQQRVALQVCAAALFTTEALLAAAAGPERARELFDWLRELSFVEEGPDGLHPHELARDVLHADFRWRHPEQMLPLNRAILRHLYERLRQARGLGQQRIWLEVIYVQRCNAALRPAYEGMKFGSGYAEPPGPDDQAAMVAMVRQHEGEEAAALARHWWQRQPEAFVALRDAGGELIGFVCTLRLDRASAADVDADPATAAARDWMRSHAPPAAGEEVLYTRWWVERDAYHQVSQAFTLVSAVSSLHWTGSDRLAWAFVALTQPAAWLAFFDELHFRRVAGAEFTVGGRPYVVVAHDWRVETAAQWLDAKAERASRTDGAAASEVQPALSEAEFSGAVRDALRDYSRPDRLAGNALLRTRLLAAGDSQGGPERLRAALAQAVEALAGHPRDNKLHLALWHTYLQPAPSQERAAELLDLPFNTYRYHLQKGTERVAAVLWQRELQARRS